MTSFKHLTKDFDTLSRRDSSSIAASFANTFVTTTSLSSSDSFEKSKLILPNRKEGAGTADDWLGSFYNGYGRKQQQEQQLQQNIMKRNLSYSSSHSGIMRHKNNSFETTYSSQFSDAGNGLSFPKPPSELNLNSNINFPNFTKDFHVSQEHIMYPNDLDGDINYSSLPILENKFKSPIIQYVYYITFWTLKSSDCLKIINIEDLKSVAFNLTKHWVQLNGQYLFQNGSSNSNGVPNLSYESGNISDSSSVLAELKLNRSKSYSLQDLHLSQQEDMSDVDLRKTRAAKVQKKGRRAELRISNSSGIRSKSVSNSSNTSSCSSNCEEHQKKRENEKENDNTNKKSKNIRPKSDGKLCKTDKTHSAQKFSLQRTNPALPKKPLTTTKFAKNLKQHQIMNLNHRQRTEQARNAKFKRLHSSSSEFSISGFSDVDEEGKNGNKNSNNNKPYMKELKEKLSSLDSCPKSTLWSNIDRTFSLNNSWLPSSDENFDVDNPRNQRANNNTNTNNRTAYHASNSEITDADIVTDSSEFNSTMFLGKLMKKAQLNHTKSLPARRQKQKHRVKKIKFKKEKKISEVNLSGSEREVLSLSSSASSHLSSSSRSPKLSLKGSLSLSTHRDSLQASQLELPRSMSSVKSPSPNLKKGELYKYKITSIRLNSHTGVSSSFSEDSDDSSRKFGLKRVSNRKVFTQIFLSNFFLLFIFDHTFSVFSSLPGTLENTASKSILRRKSTKNQSFHAHKTTTDSGLHSTDLENSQNRHDQDNTSGRSSNQLKDPAKIIFETGWRRTTSASNLLHSGLINKQILDALRRNAIDQNEIKEQLKENLFGLAPISGIINMKTNESISLTAAYERNILPKEQLLLLLEAQTACGNIFDIASGEVTPLENALKINIIPKFSQKHLATVEGAVYGYVDPRTNEMLSTWQALDRKLLERNLCLRILGVQIATGGIVNPFLNHRVPTVKALDNRIIDEATLDMVQSGRKEYQYFLPNGETQLCTYDQLMAQAQKCKNTNLPLLPYYPPSDSGRNIYHGSSFHGIDGGVSVPQSSLEKDTIFGVV